MKVVKYSFKMECDFLCGYLRALGLGFVFRVDSLPDFGVNWERGCPSRSKVNEGSVGSDCAFKKRAE